MHFEQFLAYVLTGIKFLILGGLIIAGGYGLLMGLIVPIRGLIQ